VEVPTAKKKEDALVQSAKSYMASPAGDTVRKREPSAKE